MSNPSTIKASPTPQHLIVEYKSTESVVNSIAPSVKLGKVNVATVRIAQVLRHVYTLATVEDFYFEGRKLPAMPGIRELAVEYFKPGRQIVSVPNGQVAVLYAYRGEKNIFQAAVLQQRVRSFPMRFMDTYGHDPAPERILCDNPSVPFVQHGDGDPTAAAYYNSATKRFEIIPSPDRRTLLENFMRRFGRQTVMTG